MTPTQGVQTGLNNVNPKPKNKAKAATIKPDLNIGYLPFLICGFRHAKKVHCHYDGMNAFVDGVMVVGESAPAG
jgi:hypothetical protein